MTPTLILSPDTDLYHSLPLPHGSGNIVIQITLSVHPSIELKYLHLLAFVTVLQNDPDLSGTFYWYSKHHFICIRTWGR